MRIVFVAIGAEQLGIGTLSALLRRAGHDARLVFNPALFDDRYNLDIPLLKEVFRRDARIVSEIVAHEPDVVVFSPLTVTYRWTIDTARAVKAAAPAARIVLGGVHTSAVPEVVIAEACVDAIGVGEGDLALPAYVATLPAGGPTGAIPNLWWKRSDGAVVRGGNSAFLPDLDSLPFSDKELFEDVIDLPSNYLVMGSRGCPYRCTFCLNNFWAELPDGEGGRFVRHRSPEHLLAELLWAKRRYAFRHVEFVDDVFTVNHKWLREVLGRYRREIGVPFSCLTHAKYLNDEVARLLADAGCESVQMGIQSMDEDYRRKRLRRVERARDVERALTALEKYGVRFTLDHIFGFPGEADAAQEAALALYGRFRPHRVNTFWLTYFPGTQIFREAVAEGRLTAEEASAIERGGAVSYHQPRDSDAASVHRYLRYELLFKSIPLLGPQLGDLLSKEVTARIPRPALRALIYAADVASAVRTGNQDMAIYARHYAREMARAWLPRRSPKPPGRENPSLTT
ncbi:MAG: radical SAM protein [Myxococcales bacterium]|nr:radical SAM protein [Myxococcales bacterium]